MSTHIDTHTLAEIVADLADMFTDTIDDDSLMMLLTYCLEISALVDGYILVLNTSQSTSLVLGSSGRINNPDIDSSQVVQRSLRTLNPECGITTGLDGVHGEFAFPLRIRGTAIGAIVLKSRNEVSIDRNTQSIVQSIADLAASAIDQTHKLSQAKILATQLQTALDSRIVIEQAKGVLAATNRTDISSAFAELRATARREQRPIKSVAADVVSGVQIASEF